MNTNQLTTRILWALAIAALIIAWLLIQGCAQTREWTQQAVAEELANVENERDIARKLISVWQFRSAELRCVLFRKFQDLPASTIAAFGMLDIIAMKPPDSLTDEELGTFMGLLWHIYGTVPVKIYEAIAPEILSLLRPLIGR